MRILNQAFFKICVGLSGKQIFEININLWFLKVYAVHASNCSYLKIYEQLNKQLSNDFRNCFMTWDLKMLLDKFKMLKSYIYRINQEQYRFFCLTDKGIEFLPQPQIF